ncbi:MAG: hypothetical protein S4CHLAM37_02890 [Chlamydiia bacterium]|nr:hypothetical protein [Chlamydiia bacterium]
MSAALSRVRVDEASSYLAEVDRDHQYYREKIEGLAAYRDCETVGFSEANRAQADLNQVKGDIISDIRSGNNCKELAALLEHPAFTK